MKYLVFLLILCSCSANNKLRRAERLIKEAEAMGSRWHVDTVYKEIPYYIDSVRVDSIFIAKVGDTVVIEKDRLRIKYVRVSPDSVYIQGECEADTVYQKVPITVTKTISAKSDYKKWLIIGIISGALCVIFVRRILA